MPVPSGGRPRAGRAGALRLLAPGLAFLGFDLLICKMELKQRPRPGLLMELVMPVNSVPTQCSRYALLTIVFIRLAFPFLIKTRQALNPEEGRRERGRSVSSRD